ncbi:MAG TPA: hypothetical protein VFF73_16790, partial [Planctomycetota bacterium]|nr:hypothetical protein [Planctomycetota bacterium]
MGKRPFFLLTGALFLAGIAGFIAIAAPFHSEHDAATDFSASVARATGTELETPSSDAAIAPSSSSDGAKDEAETASRRARDAEEESLARRGGAQAPTSTTSRPAGPGGSHLYTGGGRAQRLNPQLLLTSDVNQDAKIAENERSSDVADKRGSIIGAIASVDTGTIAGWAYDWNDLVTVANVDVFVDGSYVQTVQANAARPTFDPTNPQNPINQRAWICPSPPALSDGDRHVIVALGYRPDSSSKTALQSSPWTFGGNQWPQGQLLWVTPTVIYGWANDPNNPGAPVTITIAGDGNPIAKIRTSPAENAAAYAQALAASPSKKSVIQLEGLSGPADPNLGAVLAAKVQAIAQGNHYLDMRPLAAAGTNVAYDEYDFVAAVVSSDPIALPGTERAAVKFWQITDGTQAFVYVPAQPLTASWIQVQVTSSDGSMTHDVSGSPKQIGGGTNRLPIGAVCFVSSTQISGWAADPDVLPGAISVDVV